MNKYTYLFTLLIFMSCVTPGNDDRGQEGSSKETAFKPNIEMPIETPFSYSCYGQSSLEGVFAPEAGFEHERYDGATYRGEIIFDGKCKELKYYLFTFPGDVLVPIVDIYKNGKFIERINIYENGHGCAGDMGYHRKEKTEFKSNGKIVSSGITETFEVDSINFDAIDSTRKISYDTLIMDLKDYCIR